MDKSPGSINLLSKKKIKKIDAGVDYSIIMAKYKFKSSANVLMIKKRDWRCIEFSILLVKYNKTKFSILLQFDFVIKSLRSI